MVWASSYTPFFFKSSLCIAKESICCSTSNKIQLLLGGFLLIAWFKGIIGSLVKFGSYHMLMSSSIGSREMVRDMYTLLKFHPDAHHFCLGFCAGLLCVGCILPHDFSLSGVDPDFLSLKFNICLGLNCVFAYVFNTECNVYFRWLHWQKSYWQPQSKMRILFPASLRVQVHLTPCRIQIG